MKYVLGVDIGTSGTKTVLFDLSGNVLGSCTVEYPLYQPKNGWAEQDPEEWWAAVCDSIRGAIAKADADPSEIGGIGLSGQMHGTAPPAMSMRGRPTSITSRSDSTTSA